MELVGPAAEKDVLAATPDDPATIHVVKGEGPHFLWRIDAADVAKIRTQLPKETREDLGVALDDDGQGTIPDLYPLWTCWLHSGRPTAELELARHKYFVAAIDEYAAFAVRPILFGDDMKIRDGKHRLLASYELGLVLASPLRERASTWTRRALQLEVYWNRNKL